MVDGTRGSGGQLFWVVTFWRRRRGRKGKERQLLRRCCQKPFENFFAVSFFRSTKTCHWQKNYKVTNCHSCFCLTFFLGAFGAGKIGLNSILPSLHDFFPCANIFRACRRLIGADSQFVFFMFTAGTLLDAPSFDQLPPQQSRPGIRSPHWRHLWRWSVFDSKKKYICLTLFDLFLNFKLFFFSSSFW